MQECRVSVRRDHSADARLLGDDHGLQHHGLLHSNAARKGLDLGPVREGAEGCVEYVQIVADLVDRLTHGNNKRAILKGMLLKEVVHLRRRVKEVL